QPLGPSKLEFPGEKGCDAKGGGEEPKPKPCGRARQRAPEELPRGIHQGCLVSCALSVADHLAGADETLDGELSAAKIEVGALDAVQLPNGPLPLARAISTREPADGKIESFGVSLTPRLFGRRPLYHSGHSSSWTLGTQERIWRTTRSTRSGAPLSTSRVMPTKRATVRRNLERGRSESGTLTPGRLPPMARPTMPVIIAPPPIKARIR